LAFNAVRAAFEKTVGSVFGPAIGFLGKQSLFLGYKKMQRIAVCGLLCWCVTLPGWFQSQEPERFADGQPTHRGHLVSVETRDDAQLTSGEPQEVPEKLAIVWTTGDPEVAHRMVLMYGSAAKSNQWFNEVRLIIWGPSARLVAADKDIQAKLKDMQQKGITLEACVVCADSYGVSDRLRELGIEVKPMGKPLSNIIRDQGTHLITF
jgi:hypothetical protein